MFLLVDACIERQCGAAGAAVESAEDSYAAGEAIARELKQPSLRGVLLLSEGLCVNVSELVRWSSSTRTSRAAGMFYFRHAAFSQYNGTRFDALACPACPSGRLRIIAAITQAPTIKNILTHLELDDEPPPPQRAQHTGISELQHGLHTEPTDCVSRGSDPPRGCRGRGVRR